jgi:hypothetical protein
MGATTINKDPAAAQDAVTENELSLPLPQLTALTPAETKAVAGGLVRVGRPAIAYCSSCTSGRPPIIFF